MTDGKDSDRSSWSAAMRYSSVGLEIGLAPIVGYGIGWWLDRKLGTKPGLTIVMVFAGIIAGFRTIYRVLKQAQREAQNHDEH